jgi:hypothetical protein
VRHVTRDLSTKSGQDPQQCETPDQAAAYWKSHIATHPYFNSECECLVVFILNTRRRIKGHYLVSIGTMDTILCHPREVFRLAIMASAATIIRAENRLRPKRTLKLLAISSEPVNLSKSKSSITSLWEIPTTHRYVRWDIFTPSRSRLREKERLILIEQNGQHSFRPRQIHSLLDFTIAFLQV